MDRSLKFKKLAHELLVHSDDFEIFASKGQNAIDALGSLGGLEQLTQDSFASFRPQPVEPVEPVVEPVVEPIAAPAAPQAAKPDARLNEKVGATFSSRTEYKSALKDPSLVDALLAFHQGAVVRNETPKKAPAREPRREVLPAQPERPQRKEKPTEFSLDHVGGFSHASIPEIEASPKRDAHFRKSSGNATKVLRS